MVRPMPERRIAPRTGNRPLDNGLRAGRRDSDSGDQRMAKRPLSYLLLGTFMLSLAAAPVLAQQSGGGAGGGGTSAGGGASTGGAGAGTSTGAGAGAATSGSSDKSGTTGTMTTTPHDAKGDAQVPCPAGQMRDATTGTCR